MSRTSAERFEFVKGESRASKETQRRYALLKNAVVYSLINIEPDYQSGTLRPSRGFKKIGNLGVREPVWNMNISKDDDNTARFTAISNGKVFDVTGWRDNTFVSTLMANGLNTGYVDIIPVCDKLNATNYLVLLDGDYPHKYDFKNYISLTGTVSITASSATITGTDTKFLTELAVNDVIAIACKNYTVKSITNDTSLTVTTNFSSTLSGLPFYKQTGTGARSKFVSQQLTDHHKASVGIFLNERLWTNNCDEKSYINWSAAGKPTDWVTQNDAGALMLGSGLDPITAISSLFVPGDNSTHIIVAKENEIRAIAGSSGSAEDSNRFRAYEIALKYIGTNSPRGLLQAGGEVYILGKDDIKPYSTSNTQGLIQPNNSFFESERPIYREKVNIDYVKNGFMFYASNEGRNGRFYCNVPVNNNTKNNGSFVYDFSGGWFRRDYHQYSFASMVLDEETGKIYAGDYHGNIYEFNEGLNYDGNGYVKFIDFGYVNWGYPTKLKTLTVDSFIELEVISDFDLPVSIIKKDMNGLIIPEQRNISLKSKQAKYGTSRYNEVIYNQDMTVKKYLEIEGSFDEICLQLSVFDPEIDFKFRDLYLEANIRG